MAKKKEEVVEKSTKESEVVKKEPKNRTPKVVKVEEKEEVEVKKETSVFFVGKYMVDVDFFLNVRVEPNPTAKIVTTLKKNSVVDVFEFKDGWGRVGDNAWVNMKYMQRK